MKVQTVSDLIKEARKPKNQADFARDVGKTQALISKYENGSANPPMSVVNKCLKIIHDRNDSDVSSNKLAKRLKKLNDPAHLHIRKVIESMLNAAKV